MAQRCARLTRCHHLLSPDRAHFSSLWQLVFGQLVCLFFLSLHLRWWPYRDPSCDKLQFIVLVQLFVTYSFGVLYHYAPDEVFEARAAAENDSSGDLMMIGVNCVVFVAMFVIDAVGLSHMVHEMSDLRMMWSDGWLLDLHAPVAGSFHAFLSHDAISEKTMQMLEIRLEKLIPTCNVFIHTDGMKDGSMIETNVIESDVFVAMVNDTYLNYANCRRELVAALHAKKKMILLLDAGSKSGDTRPVTAETLRLQLELLDERPEFTDQERRAAERLIKVVESGSMEHLKKKELSDLLGIIQGPKASKAVLKLQKAFRGAAERLHWLDSLIEVSVTLQSGHGLMAADSNGKSDPYAKLQLGKHAHTSHIKYKTLDPVWSQKFTWKGRKGALLKTPLHVKVYDHDTFSFDDYLGEAMIHLAPLVEEIAEHQEQEITCPLETQGGIVLKFSWAWYDATSNPA